MFFDVLELLALTTGLLGIFAKFTGDLPNATYFVALSATMLLVVVINLIRQLINKGN